MLVFCFLVFLFFFFFIFSLLTEKFENFKYSNGKLICELTDGINVFVISLSSSSYFSLWIGKCPFYT
jgi:hypothetical protein